MIKELAELNKKYGEDFSWTELNNERKNKFSRSDWTVKRKDK